MKFLKHLFSLFIFSISIQSLDAQITSADAMANKIFTTLKAKDEKAYVALYPNKEQMSRLMAKMMKGIMSEMKSSPEAMGEFKKEGAANIDSIVAAELQKKASPEEVAKMEAKYAKDFNKMIEQGEKKGINWNTIQLVKFDMDTAVVADEAMQKLFGSDQFRSMKGVIHFTANNGAYKMSFNDVMYLPEEGGWFGAKLRQLVGERENFIVDGKKKEVTLESIEEDELPPPPPPPAKPKTKTASSKTKTKTKS